MTPANENPAKAKRGLGALPAEIGQRLQNGLSVRRTLPGDGRVHIDRPLPFLTLYRRPLDRSDRGMEELVKSEASYLFVSPEPSVRPGIVELIRTVSAVQQESFGSFLLLEIFSRPPSHVPLVSHSGQSVVPAFRIFSSGAWVDHFSLVECLERYLGRIKLSSQTAVVEVVSDPKAYPQRAKPVFSPHDAEEIACLQLSIEIEPVFRSPDGEVVFPALLRSLRASFARSLRHAFHLFAERHTTHRPKNFHSLGRRAMVKAVWEVDEKLDRIAKGFDFLLDVTPINSDAAWREFRRSGFEHAPRFKYRPLPIDPSLAKRSLYSVPIERIEDPTIAQLFLEKQAELDRQITMLADRGTRQFLFASIQLYGWIEDDLLRAAESVIERVPAERARGERRLVKAEEFKRLALAEIEHYRNQWDGFEAGAEIQEGLSGLIVSRGRLLIPRRLEVTADRINALLHHEVGTHLVTYFNGSAQSLTQLRSGLAGYEELQEGLATLSEYLARGMTPSRLRTLAARVSATHMVMNRATFIDVFRLLCRYGFPQRRAFDISLRVFRSGGLTKDVIYLRGLRNLLSFLQGDDEIAPLFVGKIAMKHLPIVRELQSRGVIVPSRLSPRIFQEPETQERIQRLRKGIQLHELVD